MKSLLFILLLFYSALSFSQQHSDCNNALVLINEDTINILHNANWATGNEKEFTGKIGNDSIFVPEERQSFWYLFPITQSGTFTFLLKGEKRTDDWDFMLFKVKDYPNSCPDIKAKMLLPLRSNMANNKMNHNGKTGLNSSTKHKFVAPGVGNSFCKDLKVKKGDTLLLYTGNWNKNGDGQNLSWKIIPPPKPKVYVSIKVEDKETHKKLKANVTLYNAQTTKKTQIKNVSHITEAFDLHSRYMLNISANGYDFKTIDFAFTAKSDTINKIVYLSVLKKGNKINLPNIQFFSGKATFLNSSMPYLNSLLDFMANNKTVAIEIQGYVNGPGVANSNYFILLSQQRADAVKNYLSQNGIDVNRLTTKGFGNEDMIYPNPTTAEQNEANRRVEIVVTKVK